MMTQHILMFVDKSGKECDRIYMNSPVNHAWRYEVIEEYSKKNKEVMKKILKQNGGKRGILNEISIFRAVLYPLCSFINEKETSLKIYEKDQFKENGVVTLKYSKEEGWATNKTKYDLIDSKKDYSYVVYGGNDGGEFDKDTDTYKKIIAFTKCVIVIDKINEGEI